jgi:putative salt-induced outer membrane protein YdiY
VKSWIETPSGPLAPTPARGRAGEGDAPDCPNRTVFAAFIVLWLVAACASVSAQGVAPPRLWSGRAELSLVAATGNTSTRTLGASGELDFRPDGWTVTTQARGVHSADNEQVQAASLTGLLRVSHVLRDGFQAFGQTGYLRNTFAGIGRRVTVEGGLSYALIPDSEPQAIEVRGGLGYLYERHMQTPTTKVATGSAGARYRWRVSSHSEVSDEVVATSNFADGRDWRLSQNASVTAAVAGRVSLKVSQQVDFRHEPEPGFLRTDTLTSAAMVVTF